MLIHPLYRLGATRAPIGIQSKDLKNCNHFKSNPEIIERTTNAGPLKSVCFWGFPRICNGPEKTQAQTNSRCGYKRIAFA